MSGTLAPTPRHTFFDANGDPLASGTLETYEAGTSTATATYADADLNTANPTTITLNSAGRPSVSGSEVGLYIPAGTSQKWIVKNSSGSVQWTQDGIASVPSATINLDVEGTAGENLAAGDAAYLSDGSGGLTAGRWYKTDADNAYSSSEAGQVGMVPEAIASGESGSIRLAGRLTDLAGLTPGALYYVSATAGALTATRPSRTRLVGSAESATVLVLTPNPSASLTVPYVDRGVAPAEGRLTLTTAVAVTTADVTAAGTIYYTPYVGNRIGLYDGTIWRSHTFAEVSLALSATSGKNYDVFLYDNSGTLTLETVEWTSDTVRATAIALQDGVYVKSGATGRRYLGTIRASGTNTTEDSYAKRFVWNFYNRVDRPLRVLEATNSWTYSTATMRQANAAAGNQLAVVVGVAEETIEARVLAHVSNSSGGMAVTVAIGEDSTTAAATGSLIGQLGIDVNVQNRILQVMASLSTIPAIGYHFYAWLEYSTATATTTWYGDNNAPTLLQSGIAGRWRA